MKTFWNGYLIAVFLSAISWIGIAHILFVLL